MNNLLLSTSGEWVQIFLVIGGIFVFIIIVANIYSNVVEKTKIDNDTAGCFWPIVMAVSIAILIGLINCKGCSTNSKGGDSGGYWDNYPRHTQMQKPQQNNVNDFIFKT